MAAFSGRKHPNRGRSPFRSGKNLRAKREAALARALRGMEADSRRK